MSQRISIYGSCSTYVHLASASRTNQLSKIQVTHCMCRIFPVFNLSMMTFVIHRAYIFIRTCSFRNQIVNHILRCIFSVQPRRLKDSDSVILNNVDVHVHYGISIISTPAVWGWVTMHRAVGVVTVACSAAADHSL